MVGGSDTGDNLGHCNSVRGRTKFIEGVTYSERKGMYTDLQVSVELD